MGRQRISALLMAAFLVLAFSACTRGARSPRPPIHPNPNMDIQPKYMPQASSAFFYDGATMRHPVEGTVARGELRFEDAVYTGREGGGYVAANPLAGEPGMLARGQERYGIYCTPCHGERGEGRGVLYERAGVESGNLHDQRIVDYPDGQIFDVVTNGLGLMAGYRYPIPPEDRWAIIAYVRQLQEEGP